MRASSSPASAAVDADRGERLPERQRAGEHEAAEHVGLEARALLVGEEGDRQRPPGDDAGLVERLDDLEPGENAERAVVAPAGAHGVDVAAHHHRRAVLEAAAQADHIADRVDRDREAELAHPADDEVAALAVGVGEREAADPAVGPGAGFGQAFQARAEPRAVHSKILSHLGPSRRFGREVESTDRMRVIASDEAIQGRRASYDVMTRRDGLCAPCRSAMTAWPAATMKHLPRHCVQA